MIDQHELLLLQEAKKLIEQKLYRLPEDIVNWAKGSKLYSIDEPIDLVCKYYEVYPERLKGFTASGVKIYISEEVNGSLKGILFEKDLIVNDEDLERSKHFHGIPQHVRMKERNCLLIIEHPNKKDLCQGKLLFKWKLQDEDDTIYQEGWISGYDTIEMEIKVNNGFNYFIHNLDDARYRLVWALQDKVSDHPKYLNFQYEYA